MEHICFEVQLCSEILIFNENSNFWYTDHPEKPSLILQSALATTDKQSSHHCLGLILNCVFGKKQKNSKYGSLEPLDGCKILLQMVATICPPGKPHSVKKKFQLFLGCLSIGGVFGFQPRFFFLVL